MFFSVSLYLLFTELTGNWGKNHGLRCITFPLCNLTPGARERLFPSALRWDERLLKTTWVYKSLKRKINHTLNSNLKILNDNHIKLLHYFTKYVGKQSVWPLLISLDLTCVFFVMDDDYRYGFEFCACIVFYVYCAYLSAAEQKKRVDFMTKTETILVNKSNGASFQTSSVFK